MTDNPGCRPGRATASALALLTSTLTLAACGPEDSDSAESNTTTPSGTIAEPAPAPNLVTTEQVESFEQGSPERALLEWWAAFQHGDQDAVVEITAERTLERVGEKRVSNLVDLLGSDLQGIRVARSRVEGDRAIVLALLLSFDVDKGGMAVEESVSGSPRVFAMAREGGWLYDEPSYLERLLDDLRR
jgi:hypothetical protein